MANLNQVNLIGRVGKDPEIRVMADGKSVANFSLAVSERYTNKSGEKVENTTWLNISCFDKLADVVKNYVTKGMELFIGGKIKIEEYQDQNGNNKQSFKIIASNVQMCSGQNNNQQSAPTKAPVPKPQTKDVQPSDLDDEIPF